MSAAAPQMQAPAPLTTGMPDPNTIKKQKEAYVKMLDEQYKQGIMVLDAQAKHQKDYLVRVVVLSVVRRRGFYIIPI